MQISREKLVNFLRREVEIARSASREYATQEKKDALDRFTAMVRFDLRAAAYLDVIQRLTNDARIFLEEPADNEGEVPFLDEKPAPKVPAPKAKRPRR